MNLLLISLGGAALAHGAYRLIDFYEQLDDTLRSLHETQPEVWEAIGKPVGRLWSPEGASSFRLPDTANWATWTDGESPEWYLVLDSKMRLKVDGLRHSKQKLLKSVFGCLVGGGIVLLGLISG
jgi:hypothetical protein